MAATKPHSNREWIEFFQSTLPKLSPETAGRYAKTIAVVDLFLTGHRLQLSDLSPRMVDDFVIEMQSASLAKSTVIRHLNILSSLVKSAVKRGWMPSCEYIREAIRRLEADRNPLPPLLREEMYGECVAMLRRAMKEGDSPEEDLLLLSLLNGAMPIEEVAMLRKGDADRLSDVSQTIIDRNIDSRRDFLFNLRQSYKTPKQLSKSVSDAILSKYGRFAASDEAGAQSLVREIWVAIAMKSGATYSETLAALDDAGSSSRYMWINTVNSVLTHDMPRWYAMHLRKGVDFEELRKEIAEQIRPVPELFYPGETIRKRVGNKMVINDKPFISNTVFFRSFPDRVQPMFSKIGDKAWCYRVTRESGSPYAVISPIDMRRFQMVIGVFTSDMEIHPLGTLVPRPGEQVMVVKAGYGNRQGEVEEVIEPTDGGSMIFRVKLSTDQGYEWRLDLDARQLQRI